MFFMRDINLKQMHELVNTIQGRFLILYRMEKLWNEKAAGIAAREISRFLRLFLPVTNCFLIYRDI